MGMPADNGLQIFEAGNGGVLGIGLLTTPGPPQLWVPHLPPMDALYISGINHPGNALRSAVARWISGQLAASLGIVYNGLGRQPSGQPWLDGSQAHVSLAHSGSFAAALINPKVPCGIDLEQIHEKAARLAPRFLSEEEMDIYKPDAEVATLLWCLKEVVYKRIGQKGLTLRGHLSVAALDTQASSALVEVSYPGLEPLVPVVFARLESTWLGWS